MRLIRRCISVIVAFLAGLIGSGIEGASSAEDKFALSEKFHIRIDYPDSWARLSPKIPNEVFALWSCNRSHPLPLILSVAAGLAFV